MVPPSSPPLDLSPEVAQKFRDSAREHGKHVYARNTERAYRSDWRIFEGWCASMGQTPLPAPVDAIKAFMLDAADGITLGDTHKASTVARYLATISTRHRRGGFPSPWENPEIQEVLSSIVKKKASEGNTRRKKRAFRAADLYQALDAIPADLQGLRDRAVILVGFATGMRRSELVAIDVEHLDRSEWGFAVHVGRSKTDQEGVGRVVGLNSARSEGRCPVRALDAWFRAAEITTGPIFRSLRSLNQPGKDAPRKLVVSQDRLSDDAVAILVKEAVARVGLEPADFAAHSLRSGFVTTADAKGKSVGQISAQTGHKSASTVLGYMQSNVLGPGSAGYGLMD